MRPAQVLEPFYETLAQTIDALEPEKEALLLAKLALLLANALGDPERAVAMIHEARKNIE